MPELRVKIVLNKGRHGIPLDKLADIAQETQKFLESFGHDLNLGNDQWVAEKFKNGSLSFDLVNPVQGISEPVITRAYKALQHITDVKTKPNGLSFGITKNTFLQFAKIASPLGNDDYVDIGIYNGSSRPKMRTLTKMRAVTIQREIEQKVRQYGGIQGKITALFSDSCKLWLHDLLHNTRVLADFRPPMYTQIVKLLESRDAVLVVEGWFTICQGKIENLEIERIRRSAEYKEGDLEKFLGCDPDFTGELSTEEYIDEIRDNSPENQWPV